MSRAGRPPLRRAARCAIEQLEERILFAWNMTLSNNALAGVSVTTVSGTTTFTATATGANVPWVNIRNALSAGNNVVVSAGTTGTETGDIADLTGAQLSFSTSNRTLTIQSAPVSKGIGGNITIKFITLSGPGSSIALSAGGTVSTGQLSGGTYASPTPLTSANVAAGKGSITVLTSPGPGPIEATTVTLNASLGIGTSTTVLPTAASNLSASTSTGAIYISNTGNVTLTGGSGIAAGSGTVALTDNASINYSGTGTAITGGTLALLASTGIGSSAHPLITSVSNLSALTSTGGIFINNSGNLSINGGVISGVNGVQDNGASGSVVLNNAGAVTVISGNDLDSVFAPDSVTVTTSSGNILLGGSNQASSFNTVTLNSAGDLLIGDTGTLTPGYVNATGGGTVLTAAGKINLDVRSYISGGSISATAGTNISLLATNGLSPAGMGTNGAPITLTTGAGGTLTVDCNGSEFLGQQSITTTGGFVNGSGTVTITADHFVISTAADSIYTGSGTVNIQPRTNAEVIQLGTTTDAELDLSNAELGVIGAGTLHIGNAVDTGNLMLTTAISYPTALALQTGGTIFANAFADSVTAPTLALSGGTGIGFSTRALLTQVSTLSAQTSTGSIFLSNTGNVVINGGVIAGVNGMQVMTSGIISFNNAGSITATIFGDILSSPGNLSVTTSSGDIILGGFNGAGFDIYAGAANSSAGTVTLNAAGNLMIGDPTTGSYGDVISAGSITLIAGGNINVDENSYVSAHATGTILATASNVSLLGTNGIFAAALATQGGVITVGTGAGGTIAINSAAATIGADSISTTRNGGNGDISLIADHIVLNAATDDINAGAGVVFIQPVTKSEAVVLGDTADTALDLSNAELGKITAGTVFIGGPAVTGNFTVSAAVSLPNVLNLALQTLGSITGKATAASITVPNLAMLASTGIGQSKIRLGTVVSSLSAQTATGGIFISNTGNVVITGGLISNVYGIQDTGGSGSIVLVSAGSITARFFFDIISAPGSVSLITSSGGDILLGGNNGSGFDSFDGTVNSTGSNITLNAAGNLLIGNSISASYAGVVCAGSATLTAGGDIDIDYGSEVSAHGTGTITATAGGNISLFATFNIVAAELATQGGAIIMTSGAGGTVTLNSDPLAVGEPTVWTTRNGGNGNITIITDHFALATDSDSIAAGTGVVTIQPKTVGQTVQLGTAADNELDISDAELDKITAGSVFIGVGYGGALTVTGPITPANTSILALLSGGSISASGAGDTLMVPTLALSASTGIGSSVIPLPTQAATLSALCSTEDIFINNTGSLAIGGGVISGVNGIQAGGSGNIVLANAGSISENVGPGNSIDSIVATGGVTVTTSSGNILMGAANGIYAEGSITVNAAGSLLIGDATGFGEIGVINGAPGSISLTAGSDIKIDEASYVATLGAGNITLTAGQNISLLATNNVNGAGLAAYNGNITLTTGATGTLTIASNANNLGEDSITTAIDFNAGAITINADHLVLDPALDSIVGSVVTIQPTSLRLSVVLGATTDGELDLSNAELARIFANTLRINAFVTGGITVTAPISINAPILSLQAGGTIHDLAASDTITVTNLAARAGTGISLDIVATGLAVRNTISGNIRIADIGTLAGIGPMTIGPVDTLDGTTGNQLGNFAPGGTTTISTAIPVTYATSVTSAGTFTQSTAESAANNNSPHTDNVTVNAGITVQSTGGDVVFLAGDDIVINSTAQILAPGGNIDLRAGFNDTDNEGVILLNGTVSASPAVGTVALNVNASNAGEPGGSSDLTEGATGSVTSAGLLLLNLPASGRAFSMNASSTNAVGMIAATTQAPISYRNSGGMTVGAVNSPNEGIISFGILTTNQSVLLQTSGILTLVQFINSGTAATTLTPTGGDVNGQSNGGIIASSITQTSGTTLSTYAGTLSAGTGGIQFTGNSFSLTGPISDSGPFTLSDTGTAALSGALSGAGIITKNGSGTLVLNGPLPAKIALTAKAGSTTMARNSGSGIRQLSFAAINISAGAKVIFANTSATLGDYSHHANRTVAVVDAGGLNIASGGTFDMGDNDMILKYAPTNETVARNLVSGLLASGFDGGGFDTAGINSSEASYDANFGSGTRALGWMDNNDIGANTFDGVNTSDLNEVMVKFTYYGDSDLSGTVDATDFGLYAAGKSNAGTGWAFGNYDYNSTTADATDFGLFAAGSSGYKQFGAL